MAADIYQEIWDADQSHAGLRAVAAGSAIDEDTRDHGYVIVDERKTSDPDHRLLTEVVIPAHKRASYDRVELLFNNYTLDQTKPEESFSDEEAEVQAFLEAVHDTPPMRVARAYAASRAGREITKDAWWAILERIWFEQFDMGASKDLSGFEHVIVGEQKQGKVQGYHFWYKYHVDESFRLPALNGDGDGGGDEAVDLIRFLRWRRKPDETTPDVVTLSYQWSAFDYQARQYRKLTKPIGGFWVGGSVEGLMALGTVRCLAEASAPRRAVINNVQYDLPMYRSPNDRNLRTFYPEFVSMV